MTINIPESDSEDEEDQTKIGVKPVFDDAVYERFFEKYEFNYPIDKFFIEVINFKRLNAIRFFTELIQ
jgi:hypothetical protein